MSLGMECGSPRVGVRGGLLPSSLPGVLHRDWHASKAEASGMFHRGVGDRAAFSGEAGLELPPEPRGMEKGWGPAQHMCVSQLVQSREVGGNGKLLQSWVGAEAGWG